MPYIEDKDESRAMLASGWSSPCNPGELNFVITNIIHRYIKEHGLSYQILNSVIGVLECAKLELYRVVVAPYENKKRRENGPVSELDALNLEDIR